MCRLKGSRLKSKGPILVLLLMLHLALYALVLLLVPHLVSDITVSHGRPPNPYKDTYSEGLAQSLCGHYTPARYDCNRSTITNGLPLQR
jgi:hypothetical protein